MPNKTITKFFAFVISIILVSMIAAACRFASSNELEDTSQSPYGAPQVTGKLESNDITEASGLAASKCQADLFWTHNDSGDDAYIFAINSTGKNLGTWKVRNASNIDWEDIAEFKNAAGECFIYIGEIGNNSRKRSEGVIYRVKEPTVSPADSASSRKDPRETGESESLKFRYPDSNHNAESLMVHPQTGDIYILTKNPSDPSGVYKLKAQFNSGQITAAEKIADITVPSVPNGLITGGDISSDGKRVAICDYFGAYELALPDGVKNFDEIWKQKPVKFDIGTREVGEAIAYSPDGNSIFAVSEGERSPVFKVTKRGQN